MSYAPPAASPLQDDDGNRVVAFTDLAVQNLAPLPPALENAVARGRTIKLTFDEDLRKVSLAQFPADAFSLKIDGAPRSVIGLAFVLDIPDEIALRYDDPDVVYGDVVTVSYAPPAANPLQDAGGNRVLAFTDVAVQNNVSRPSDVPPALESAVARGRTIKLTFDEDLRKVSLAQFPADAFSLKIDGAPRSVIGLAFVLDIPDEIALRYDAPDVAYGDEVTVSYAPPATDPLQDAGGNRVAAFTDVMVRNDEDRPASLPPKLVDAEVITATTVAVNFDEDLKTASMPASSAFTVKVNGRTPAIAGVYLLAIDRDSVRLTVDEEFRRGDVVTVSYAPPAINALQDADGNDVAEFTDFPVRNELPISDAAPATPPTVDDVLISSEPADGEYVTGDRIEVTVTFDQPVSISGPATGVRMGLTIGSTARLAFLTERVSGVRALMFRTNPLLATDVDDDGVSIVANSLAVAGGATIRNASGLDAVLTHDEVADDPGHRVNVAPVLVGATLTGQTNIALKFDEDLKITSTPDKSAFTVKVVKVDSEVQTRSIETTFHVQRLDKEFHLVLAAHATDVVYGDMVTVSYVPPAANPLQDAGGNRVAAFTEVRVNVPRPAGVPPANPEAEVINGNTVAVNFDGDLDTDSTPATSAFTVKVNSDRRTVTAVHLLEIDRDSVRLTVDGGIRHGDVVTVSYEKPAANPLQDAAGNPVATFPDITARNDLPATITLTAAPASVGEGADATTITVTATLDGGAVAAETTVNVEVAGGTATVADDFAAVTGFSITITANSASAMDTFTLTPVDDSAQEDAETVTVSGTATGFVVNPAAVTITDNDEQTCTPAAPRDALWSACLTVGEIFSTLHLGFSGSVGGLSDEAFTHGSTDYTISTFRSEQPSGAANILFFTVGSRFSSAEEADLILHVGSSSFAFTDASYDSSNGYQWTNSGLSWSVDEVISVWITTTPARAPTTCDLTAPGNAVWSGCVAVEKYYRFYETYGFYEAKAIGSYSAGVAGDLTDKDFDHKGVSHTVGGLYNERQDNPMYDDRTHHLDSGNELRFVLDRALGAQPGEPFPDETHLETKLVLHVGGEAFAMSDAWVARSGYGGEPRWMYGWANAGLSWADGDAVSAWLAPAAQSQGATGSPITGFTLFDNANGGADVQALTDGAALAALSSGRLNIRAEAADGAEIGSVRMALSGAVTSARTEGVAPYALFGDRGGRAFPAGTYTVTATPYPERGLSGTPGPASSVTFTVAGAAAAPSVTVTSTAQAPVSGEFQVTVRFSEPVAGFRMSELVIANGRATRSASLTDRQGYATEHEVYVAPDAGASGEITITVPAGVATDADGNPNTASAAFAIAIASVWDPLTGFTLFDNAAGGADVRALSDGTVLRGLVSGQLNVRADTRSGASIGSVRMALSGAASSSRTENYAPWALFGDRGGRAFAPGSYTVTATPYPERDLGGTAGKTRSVTFRVVLPALSVADARAEEGTDETIDFAVTLDAASRGRVTVDYATSDGTAKAGADYAAKSGTLTFTAGETAKTVAVTVLDDAIDEGSETLTLTLSNASGATIADGTATGTITNNDPLQKMWLSRFGRTVAGHVVDAVAGRLSGPSAGTQVTLGGQSIGLSGTEGDADAAAAALDTLAGARQAREAGDAWAGSGAWPDARGGSWRGAAEGGAPAARSMTGRELLLGSAFHLASDGDAGGGPAWAAWGRVTAGGFDAKAPAEKGTVRMDGEVTTGILGADAAWDRWLAGVALSVSEGEGTFDQPGVDRGTLESSLTAVHPYVRVDVNERVSAWGLLGYGTGEMTMTQAARGDRGEIVTRTDIEMRLGAAGARGALLEAADAGGFDLALRADAFLVQMEWEKVSNETDTRADASRVRLVLEGSRAFEMAGGAVLTPGLELGLRHDGGDAETGTGVEAGGSVRYADPESGLTVEASARRLLAHEDSGFGEWGVSGSVRLDPGASGRGLSLTLAPTIGAASSGMDRLWSARDAAGLAANDDFEAERRLEAEVGYGFGGPEGLGVVTPYAGLGLAGGDARTWRAGARWSIGPSFALSLDGTRRESANDNAAEHGVGFRLTARF